MPHGQEKGRGNAIMMKRSEHRGGRLHNGMNNDLGNGHERIGTHGMQAHGPDLARPGRQMTDMLGRDKDQVKVEANELRLGGSVNQIIKYQ